MAAPVRADAGPGDGTDAAKERLIEYVFIGAGPVSGPAGFVDAGSETGQSRVLWRCPQVDHAGAAFPKHNSLLMFCLPSDHKPRRISSRAAPAMWSFLLTDEASRKLYGTTVTYPEICESQPDHVEVRCICILSRWPFLATFSEFLAELLCMVTDPSLSRTAAQQLMEANIGHLMYQVPLPPPGKVAVQFDIGDVELQISRPLPHVRPGLVDLVHLQLLLEVFAAEDLLKLVVALLAECQVVMYTATIELLLPVAEALKSLLFPLQWVHVYIPYVPSAVPLNDLVEAPVPYFIGMEATAFAALTTTTANFVAVNLDSGRIHVSAENDAIVRIPSSIHRKVVAAVAKCPPPRCSAKESLAARTARLNWAVDRMFISDATSSAPKRPPMQLDSSGAILQKIVFKNIVQDLLHETGRHITRTESKDSAGGFAVQFAQDEFIQHRRHLEPITTAVAKSQSLACCLPHLAEEHSIECKACCKTFDLDPGSPNRTVVVTPCTPEPRADTGDGDITMCRATTVPLPSHDAILAVQQAARPASEWKTIFDNNCGASSAEVCTNSQPAEQWQEVVPPSSFVRSFVNAMLSPMATKRLNAAPASGGGTWPRLASESVVCATTPVRGLKRTLAATSTSMSKVRRSLDNSRPGDAAGDAELSDDDFDDTGPLDGSASAMSLPTLLKKIAALERGTLGAGTAPTLHKAADLFCAALMRLTTIDELTQMYNRGKLVLHPAPDALWSVKSAYVGQLVTYGDFCKPLQLLDEERELRISQVKATFTQHSPQSLVGKQNYDRVTARCTSADLGIVLKAGRAGIGAIVCTNCANTEAYDIGDDFVMPCPGDAILAVNSRQVFGMHYQDITALMRNTSRPMTVELLRPKLTADSTLTASSRPRFGIPNTPVSIDLTGGAQCGAPGCGQMHNLPLIVMGMSRDPQDYRTICCRCRQQFVPRFRAVVKDPKGAQSDVFCEVLSLPTLRKELEGLALAGSANPCTTLKLLREHRPVLFWNLMLNLCTLNLPMNRWAEQAGLVHPDPQLPHHQVHAECQTSPVADPRLMDLHHNVAELKTQQASIRASMTNLGSMMNEQLAMSGLSSMIASIGQLQAQLQAERCHKRKLEAALHGTQGKIRVLCRIRPPHGEGMCLTQTSDAVVALALPEGGGSKVFEFDRIIGPAATQAHVYDEVASSVRAAVEGYNACILAYGQTGAGKTFTMEGPAGHHAPHLRGVNYRALDTVFAELQDAQAQSGIAKFTVTLNCIEIYNEQFVDLLHSEEEKKVEVHHKAAKTGQQVQLVGAQSRIVTKTSEAMAAMAEACRNRTFASNNVNQHSSRSHAITLVNLACTLVEQGSELLRESKLVLVDLAGAERMSTTKITDPARITEARHINKSLSALGNVVSALLEQDAKGNKAHIPYRNSKLTTLLADCIGGSAKTTMIVAVSPDVADANETSNCLLFGSRVRNVENNVTQQRATAQVDVGKVKATADKLSTLQTENEQLRQAVAALEAKLAVSEARAAAAEKLAVAADSRAQVAEKSVAALTSSNTRLTQQVSEVKRARIRSDEVDAAGKKHVAAEFDRRNSVAVTPSSEAPSPRTPVQSRPSIAAKRPIPTVGATTPISSRPQTSSAANAQLLLRKTVAVKKTKPAATGSAATGISSPQMATDDRAVAEDERPVTAPAAHSRVRVQGAEGHSTKSRRKSKANTNATVDENAVAVPAVKSVHTHTAMPPATPIMAPRAAASHVSEPQTPTGWARIMAFLPGSGR